MCGRSLHELYLLRPALSINISAILFISRFLRSKKSHNSFAFCVSVVLFCNAYSICCSNFIGVMFIISLGEYFSTGIWAKVQSSHASECESVKAKSHNGNMVLRFSVRNNSMLSGNSDDWYTFGMSVNNMNWYRGFLMELLFITL